MPPKMIEPSRNAREVRYAIRDIVVLASQVAQTGKKMIWLNIGDPCPYGHKTPEHVIEAACRSMREQKNGYAPSFGYPEAVEAIRRHYEKQGFRSIAEIVCTTGASEAIDLALGALLNPGDNVLLPYPVYPLYSAVLARMGVDCNPYYLHEDNGWLPSLSELEALVDKRTRAIVIGTPNNPTGAIWPRSLLYELAELARKKDLLVIADEIYDKLILDDTMHWSIAALAPDLPVVTCNGLSKSYLVPGWRCGWAVITGDPEKIHDYAQTFGQLARARLCANAPAMAAIPAALDGPQDHITSFVKKLKESLQTASRCIRNIKGITMTSPKGAFYAFPKLEIGTSDEEWAKKLITETGVVVVPGSGFGQKPGSKHFRFVFLPDPPLIEEAFEKIADFMKRCG